MAEPSTRETLKQYSLRALGKPVIEINVDDDQLEDRIDEAVQYFQQYHYDGIRRTYLKYKLTAADKTRLSAINGETESATDLKDNSVSIFLLVIITFAPCSAILKAIALPIPLDEPVIIAFFPVRSNRVVIIKYSV